MPDNTMYIASNDQPSTIGALRAYLDKLEASWSEQDVLFLGPFEDQPLKIAVDQQGVGTAFMQYLAEYGLVAFDIHS